MKAANWKLEARKNAAARLEERRSRINEMKMVLDEERIALALKRNRAAAVIQGLYRFVSI
jgi:hypothetical protein